MLERVREQLKADDQADELDERLSNLPRDDSLQGEGRKFAGMGTECP